MLLYGEYADKVYKIAWFFGITCISVTHEHGQQNSNTYINPKISQPEFLLSSTPMFRLS
jgi:hypothetical protein